MSKTTIKVIKEVEVPLYPSPLLKTNSPYLGFDAEDIQEALYSKRASKLDYFNYMIFLLGGEENVKDIKYNEETEFWEVGLDDVLAMYKAEEAYKEILDIPPYWDPTSKQLQETNYFLFREAFDKELRIWVNLVIDKGFGVAVIKAENDYAELMKNWAEFLDWKNSKPIKNTIEEKPAARKIK